MRISESSISDGMYPMSPGASVSSCKGQNELGDVLPAPQLSAPHSGAWPPTRHNAPVHLVGLGALLPQLCRVAPGCGARCSRSLAGRAPPRARACTSMSLVAMSTCAAPARRCRRASATRNESASQAVQYTSSTPARSSRLCDHIRGLCQAVRMSTCVCYTAVCYTAAHVFC